MSAQRTKQRHDKISGQRHARSIQSHQSQLARGSSPFPQRSWALRASEPLPPKNYVMKAASLFAKKMPPRNRQRLTKPRDIAEQRSANKNPPGASHRAPQSGLIPVRRRLSILAAANRCAHEKPPENRWRPQPPCWCEGNPWLTCQP